MGTQLSQRKGAEQPSTFRLMSIVAKQSPISATAELLFWILIVPYCVKPRITFRWTALNSEQLIAPHSEFMKLSNDLLLEVTNSNLFSVTKPATHGPTSTANYRPTSPTLSADRHCRSTFWLPTLTADKVAGYSIWIIILCITSRKWRHFRFCSCTVVIIVIKQYNMPNIFHYS